MDNARVSPNQDRGARRRADDVARRAVDRAAREVPRAPRSGHRPGDADRERPLDNILYEEVDEVRFRRHPDHTPRVQISEFDTWVGGRSGVPVRRSSHRHGVRGGHHLGAQGADRAGAGRRAHHLRTGTWPTSGRVRLGRPCLAGARPAVIQGSLYGVLPCASCLCYTPRHTPLLAHSRRQVQSRCRGRAACLSLARPLAANFSVTRAACSEPRNDMRR